MRRRPGKEERMALAQKITPCLWFDSEAEEAARFYVPFL
jgi:predicted 3-demethylubiquinone-9 3-methyltransferase (glyoxalase superfamily)